jgi:hypothetical protein
MDRLQPERAGARLDPADLQSVALRMALPARRHTLPRLT